MAENDGAPETRPERRGWPRHRTLLGAKICYGPHFAISVDCTVRSLSARGASLRVLSTQPLPAHFVLLVILEATAYEAQIVWRRGDFMGVSLGEPVDVRAPTDERLRSVRNLWLAVAPS
jgi:hypothetical protein